jgi:hypothetical protein
MRHGIGRCLLCDAQHEFLANTGTTAGDVTARVCEQCGFRATAVVEHVYIPSEDLDQFGQDLDPRDPLPEPRPMEKYRLSDTEWYVDRCRFCGRVDDDDSADAERDHDE